MKNMKLISMTDFVLNFKGNTAISHKAFEFARKSKNYANFLKQPLTLGMFVPCDQEGNVLRYPISKGGSFINAELCAYEKAEEKVLFKGFKWKEDYALNENKDVYVDEEWVLLNINVESLVEFDLELTESAIKQILG